MEKKGSLKIAEKQKMNHFVLPPLVNRLNLVSYSDNPVFAQAKVKKSWKVPTNSFSCSQLFFKKYTEMKLDTDLSLSISKKMNHRLCIYTRMDLIFCL
jgi:hypothetical protein